MDKTNGYIIDLLSPHANDLTVEYDIDDAFFQSVDGIIEHGNLQTMVKVKGKASAMFVVEIHSTGTVSVPCDRCLANVQQEVDTTDAFSVKLGDVFSDEGDVVVIPQQDGTLDMSPFIYEYIALSLPMVSVHPEGQCDETMMKKLNEYVTHDDDGEITEE